MNGVRQFISALRKTAKPVGLHRAVQDAGPSVRPISNVAAWVRPAKDGKTIESARIAIGGVASAPFLSRSAASVLIGRTLTTETINEAAHASRAESRPLDNTDLDITWRRNMVEVWVRRTLARVAKQLGN